MIIIESFYINDEEFIHTYSNSHRYIVRDNVSYSEAYDPAEFQRIYTEGELMPLNEKDEELEYAEAARILLGDPDV